MAEKTRIIAVTEIDEAVAMLARGGVVAFPTETFYGLAADAANEAAIDSIFAIKGRSFCNPIALIIAREEELSDLTKEIPAAAEKLMAAFWPGPLTLLFRAAPTVSPRLTAGTGKIGVRISSHPLAQALATGLGRPITATSANLSGYPECTTAAAVIDQIGANLPAIIDGGPTPGGKGSTIIDITGGNLAILREGSIASERIYIHASTPICGNMNK